MPQKWRFDCHVFGGRGRSGSYFSLPVGRFADGKLSGVGVPIDVCVFFLNTQECFYMFVPDHASLNRKGASRRHAPRLDTS